jgi:hypothetical protein
MDSHWNMAGEGKLETPRYEQHSLRFKECEE